MNEEQHAKWLELAADARVKLIPMPMIKPEVVLSKGWFFAFCAAITAEAVEAERERCARWQPINQEARSGRFLLVFVHQPVPVFGGGGVFIARWKDRICARGEDHGQAWFNDADQEIRLDVTHWMPLPDGPSAAAHREGEGE